MSLDTTATHPGSGESVKLTGYVGALVLVAGVAGFGLRARTQAAQPREPASLPVVVSGEEVLPSSSESPPTGSQRTDVEASVEAAPENLQERVRSPASSRQSSRGRSRNRYPGPIPTPEEWEPPDGPVRIGLQAGHWRANEAPAELSGIRDNGTRWENKPEWETNLDIASRAGALLEELGYEVDILPAVVPPSYRAHLFLSIHADGSTDSRASGFRATGPRQDPTGRASRFVELLEESYSEETGLGALPSVTHRMQNFYAFNFRRYEHALHPMTIGVILETGYLTSPRDRRVIVDNPDRAARGIVEAVKAFPETPPPRR